MNDTTEATATFAPLWRYKWLILIVAIVVAGATYAYYKRKPAVFESTTQLYLGAGAEEQGPVGESASSKSLSSSLIGNATDQSQLINTVVVEQVHKQLVKTHPKTPATRAAAAGMVVAKPSSEKSEFIVLTAEAHNAKGSALLANSTAQTYIERQQSNYLKAIKNEIAITRRQLRRIEVQPPPSASSKGSTSTTAKSPTVSTTSVLQAANLSSKINQLEAKLSVGGVRQIKPAKPKAAKLLGPTPKKNAIFGFLIGLILAGAAAYVLNRLDRRLRSLADIESMFGMQILSALPKVGNPVIHRTGEPQPSMPLLEPLRRLHATLGLGQTPLQGTAEQDGQSAGRVLLFISAEAGDGKSTLIADLALVQRDAGARVAVVEADFRRPVQAKLLDVAAAQGLGEVLEGTLGLDEAMQTVESVRHQQQQQASVAGDGAGGGVATIVGSRSTGLLSVLVSGAAVVNPPALLGSSTMTDLVRSLAGEFDYVLIDAPSPLEVSDALPLLPAVSGIVIVARVGHTREVSAQRLVQLLRSSTTAPPLGVVANRVSRADIQKYGLSSAHARRGWLRNPIGR